MGSVFGSQTKSKFGRPRKQSSIEKQGKGRWGGWKEEGRGRGRRNEGGRKEDKCTNRREGKAGWGGGDHVRFDMRLEPRKPSV